MVGIGCLQSTKDALLGWTHYQHNESAKGEALGSEREREAEEEIWGGGWGQALSLYFMMFGVNIHVQLRKKLEGQLQPIGVQLILGC
jgi:hypothetical protein